MKHEDETPWSNHNLEREVLGAAILDRSCGVLAKAAGVTVESFTRPQHRVLWKAVETLLSRGDVLDAVSVEQAVRAAGDSSVASLVDVLEITNHLPTLLHSERHATELVRLHTARRTWHAVRGLAAICDGDPEAFRKKALQELQTATRSSASKRAVPLREGVAQWWRDFDADGDESTSTPRRARFALASLDSVLGDGRGLVPGCLYVIAARPAMGKTSLAQAALLATAQNGGRCLFFSLEMQTAELVTRLLSMLTLVDSRSILRREFDSTTSADLARASEQLHRLQVEIDDEAGLTISEIRARTLLARASGPLDLIVVDHLQITAPEGRAASENETVHLSAVTGALKRLAKEVGCPVVALSQLNREVDKRPNKRPQASDLRGSGSIEQDADVVMFLYRDEVYNVDSEDRGIAEVRIAKQRGGATPTIKLRWHGPTTSFHTIEADEEDGARFYYAGAN